MRHPDLPSRYQRLEAASMAGAVQNLLARADQGVADDDAVEELLAVSRDPAVLGHVLGNHLARTDAPDGYDHGPAVRWLRAAGADEDQAEIKAAWLRDQRSLRGGQLP